MSLNRLNFSKAKRFFFFKIELKLLVLKYLIQCLDVLLENNQFNFLFSKPTFDFFSSRIVSTCVFTGRQGSVYRFFKMSRISIRDFSGNNFFFGIRKSSW